ncbi:MAG: ABC transporter substrate-binding protein [Clostridia bacterium]|nr:ABC transporter substrate-binding protein [Clostridia bacterium]
MKKLMALMLSLVMVFAVAGCGNTNTNEDATDASAANETLTVGICQLMVHDSLDAATKGFVDALGEKAQEAGVEVEFDTQVAGDANLCTTVINTFTAKDVDLIMANATPALLAAASATDSIPVLGTSVTDYTDTFKGSIPANVTGTSDAVPFDEQAKMMIDTLKLVEGDVVGVLYCTNESNSLIQYEAVKALFEEAGIVVNAYTFSETTELQALVTKAAGEIKALYVPSDNTVAANDTVVGTICNENKVPVFTSYGGAVCYASLAIDYYELGRETGLMAAEILLNGKAATDFEVKTLTPTVVYNNELCEALGIEVPAN